MLILWIDDDGDILRHQCEYIRHQGHELIVERSVDHAVTIIQESRRCFDVIMIDLMLSSGKLLRHQINPGGVETGLVLVEWMFSNNLIKEKICNTYCFIFTNRDNSAAKLWALRLGIDFKDKGAYKGTKILRAIHRESNSAGR